MTGHPDLGEVAVTATRAPREEGPMRTPTGDLAQAVEAILELHLWECPQGQEAQAMAAITNSPAGGRRIRGHP